MGLLVRSMDEILERRRGQWLRYAEALAGVNVRIASIPDGTEFNHAYFPVVLPSEHLLTTLVEDLAALDIHPRRYFYPSLSTLPYLKTPGNCPRSEGLSPRVLWLPSMTWRRRSSVLCRDPRLGAMKRKLLMLGGADIQVTAIQRARELGYHAITCDYLPGNPGHRWADEYHEVSTTDLEGVLAIARRCGIHGISAYASDPAAVTAAYVCQQLGLPGDRSRG
ncbi:MAG: DegT/DnrJ/EryC1/StrS family aminotransferase [Flavobacteriales bacterium]|nr:DegT/DnrJ/EryC1/StrS family aminotransferase [Flavobacteriales bacterium]